MSITNDAGSAVSSLLIVRNARNVTLMGKGAAVTASQAAIRCSGRALISGESDKAVTSNLAYAPVESGKPYTIKVGADKDTAEVLTDDAGNVVGAEGEEYQADLSRMEYRYICITPDGWVDPDQIPAVGPDPDLDPDYGLDPVEDGAGIAGVVVAGAAVGGAAVWGSYEVATRVILNRLLPEGATIPKTEGELALLVWQTAGKPAPAAQPAFVDVPDADMAMAAQWCVEQGYLEAGEDHFYPDNRAPKYRVIRVWNQAFPQK